MHSHTKNLFIYFADNWPTVNSEQTYSTFTILKNAIHTQRPNNNFLLLILFTDIIKCEETKESNLTLKKIKKMNYKDWHSISSKAQWEEVLDQFKFSPIPYERKEH